MQDFMDVEVITADNIISVTAFQFFGQAYVIITSNISALLHGQAAIDKIKGYDGPLLPYETMLFRGPTGDESVSLYPFGDLPGHEGIGVFQRYDDEDKARDGHQVFVTRVKNELRKRRMSEDIEQEGYYLAPIRMEPGTIDIHAMRNIPLARPNDEQQNWTCGRCQKEYRFFEAKQPLKLHDADNIITVCAQCYKELYRAKQIAVEYH